MKKDKQIEKIAKDKLGIETLKTRNSDSLDFHDVSVWGIQAALEAAYEAGQKAKKPAPIKGNDDLYKWDDINKAMMATGYSPRHILRFLSKLNEIRKGA